MSRPRRLSSILLPAAMLCTGGIVFGFSSSAAGSHYPAPQAQSALAGTSWRLVEFQSMDDAVGTLRPADPSVYTMQLADDGTVSMRLNCNRATGTWSSVPGNDSTSGTFEFGPLAVTTAMCPPPSMDERIARDAEYIRSYLLRDGNLYLSLMADGGIYAWEPDPAVVSMADAPGPPDDGGPRAFEVTGGAEVALRQEASVSAPAVATYAPARC